jgi:hypothetical protein
MGIIQNHTIPKSTHLLDILGFKVFIAVLHGCFIYMQCVNVALYRCFLHSRDQTANTYAYLLVNKACE